MNKIEFGNTLMNRLSEEMPKYTIRMETVTKMNDQQLHGITIKLTDDLTAPIIYLEEIYQQYLKGVSIDEIIGQIETIVHCTKPPVNVGNDYIPSDDTLEIRLLDPEINQKFLEDIPYITLDSGLAIICDAVMDDGHGGEYRAIINDGLLMKMGCGKQTLFNKALSNMEKKKPLLVDMADAFGLSDDNLIDSTALDPNSIYMLTNQRRILGSAQIVLKEVRSRIASLIGGAFYIIPSSLHELLIIPEKMGLTKESLESMLHDANRTVLPPEDILSDKVFFVDGKDYSLKLA